MHIRNKKKKKKKKKISKVKSPDSQKCVSMQKSVDYHPLYQTENRGIFKFL